MHWTIKFIIYNACCHPHSAFIIFFWLLTLTIATHLHYNYSNKVTVSFSLFDFKYSQLESFFLKLYIWEVFLEISDSGFRNETLIRTR